MIIQSLQLQKRQKTTARLKSASRAKGSDCKLPPITPKRSTISPKSNRTNSSDIARNIVTEKKSILEVAEERLSQPPHHSNNDCGNVIIRYNHYHKTFPIHNGVLKWDDVDKEYCLSFAFPGNFPRKIFPLPKLNEGENIYRRNATLIADQEGDFEVELLHDDNYRYFIDAVNNTEYLLKVEEDSSFLVLAQETKITCISPRSQQASSGSRAVTLLTAELKKIPSDSLNSEQAKDLIERRDIEDILFSSMARV